MKKLSSLLICILSFALLAGVYGADKPKKSKTPKADAKFEMGLYSDAMELYKKCYAKHGKNEDKGRAAFMVAECYRINSNYVEASNWYEKAYVSGNKEPKVLLNWAEMLKSNAKFDESVAKYNEYKESEEADGARANAGISAAEQAKAWTEKPTRFVIDNVTALNTKYYDFAVSKNPMSKNGVLLTSSREASTGTSFDGWYGQKYFDLFKAEQDNNGKWSTPIPLPEPINGPASEGACTFDSKGTTMFFTRCESIDKNYGSCKIYRSTYTNEVWSAPEPMHFNSNEYSVGHPTLSADGKSLYFSSDMAGGQGGHDLYLSTWNDASGAWGEPMNMGASVNTDKDEMFPHIHENGKLYFSSNGQPGMGGLDIFSAMADGGSWKVSNLKSPINTGADDFNIVFTTVTSGFFSSSREGGLGSDDIYSFVMPPPNFAVYGRVYDTDTKESIGGATVELFGSDGTSLSVKTEEEGTYRYALKPNVKYKISASYTGYLTKFAEVSTVGIDESQDFEENFDFPLKSVSRPITLPEVFYDLDKSTLRPESKSALDGLVTTLNENPTITVKLTAHTDLRASDEYNIRLSHRRARSVVKYLIKNGIDKERLSSEGKGETTPKEVENDEEYQPFKRGDKLTPEFIEGLSTNELKETAHQYNRRTEFEVLRTDYVPKTN